ncbi:MAG: anthranilate phosphoribosyltransferase [Thermoguttaceae bacterium]|jgi:anthranilate phosphoribosyltransferase|nr:anthranilate phosphoribosyltransferase [Thermoguttaceae bacterium]
MTYPLIQELRQLTRRESLSHQQMRMAVSEILAGNASSITIGAFLTALAVRGETADELAGAIDAIRRETIRVELPNTRVIDVVGTGGDSLHTFNISTAAAFVIAGAGLAVAKHGNRSVSSRCGSADVLESLGVRLDLAPEQIEIGIREVGIGFMYAQQFHRGMEHVGPVRKSLGVRTIFNMIGPLVNPAEPSFMLVGVYSPILTELFADVLRRQGVERAMVVCGADGMDELTLTGPTRVTFLNEDGLTTSNFYPELFFDEGLVPPEELEGGDPQENATILSELLQGKIAGGKKNVVLLNAGAALFIGKQADSIQHGIEMARESLESGAAFRVLRSFVSYCNDLKLTKA